ncbi:hypothetical protein CDL15_Pgr021336 [Punica granatum]|uniref:AP-2 complex subunit sigma n=1 Tax=Punica granatum TaxID=22663 RepID=A0A218WQA2_PUNGR|nr:hypothetical protein CDL15_Pgr021336 [Punica granatum]
MIRFILLQNRQGKTRLAKYYVPLEDSEKHKVEYEVHRLVVNRDPKFTNFVEFRTHKVIYRRYAGLFFSLCVDITDNELAYLECIHLFVEILDHFFSNVCELDLVFNFHKFGTVLVHAALVCPQDHICVSMYTPSASPESVTIGPQLCQPEEVDGSFEAPKVDKLACRKKQVEDHQSKQASGWKIS